MTEEFKPVPDLDGPKPSDWPFPDDHWIAAQLIHQGKTQEEAAAAVGKRRGTVANWKRLKWEPVYGPAFLPLDQRRDLEKHRRSDLGGEGTAGSWREARAAIAANLGSSGDKARVLLELVLDRYLDDPEAIERLTIRDVERLSKTALNLTLAADRLVGIRNGQDLTPPIPELPNLGGVIDGLETVPGEHQGILSKLGQMADTYIASIETAEGEKPAAPIDVEETKT